MTETDPIWGRFTIESLPFVQMIENPSLNEMIVNGGGAGFVAGTVIGSAFDYLLQALEAAVELAD